MQLNDIKEYEWLGISEKTEEVLKLSAGRLHVEFQSGRLTNFTYNNQIVLLEVYFALRDQNWNTIPFKITNLKVDKGNEHFIIMFHSEHKEGNIQYEWDAKITGLNDEISYEFTGTSQSNFLRNRIGFCVLHPANCAGTACKIIHSNKLIENGNFPKEVAPHQPFYDIQEINYLLNDGVSVITRFDGDVFEMEDQRNWTDASFKTYCTPLGIPFPVQIRIGDTVSQKITVLLKGDGKTFERARDMENTIDVKAGTYVSNINLGSVITKPLSQKQIHFIRHLHLCHLRYEYHFCNDNLLEAIIKQTRCLNLKIRLTVFFSDDKKWNEEINKLTQIVEKYKNDFIDVLIFQENTKVIQESKLKEVRKRLCMTNIPIGSGTDAFFTQNNREPLPKELLDFVSYSNNPQVHAFDNESIMETTDGQYQNVISCKKLFGGIPISISPVSMKMRWNPDLTEKEIEPLGTLPQTVDLRQMSLFAASWFIRSLASILQAGAASADYFQLIGTMGVMHDHNLPNYYFPAVPDMLYPIYYAVYFSSRVTYAETKVIKSKDYTAIIMKNNNTRILIANSRNKDIQIKILNLPLKVKEFCLNSLNVKEYALDASSVFSGSAFENIVLGKDIILKPYEIRVIDF